LCVPTLNVRDPSSSRSDPRPDMTSDGEDDGDAKRETTKKELTTSGLDEERQKNAKEQLQKWLAQRSKGELLQYTQLTAAQKIKVRACKHWDPQDPRETKCPKGFACAPCPKEKTKKKKAEKKETAKPLRIPLPSSHDLSCTVVRATGGSTCGVRPGCRPCWVVHVVVKLALIVHFVALPPSRLLLCCAQHRGAVGSVRRAVKFTLAKCMTATIQLEKTPLACIVVTRPRRRESGLTPERVRVHACCGGGV